MLPKTGHLQFIPSRIEATHRALLAETWAVCGGPLAVSRAEATTAETTIADAHALAYEPVTRTPLFWGKRFDQGWWKVQIPAGEGPRWLDWRDRGEATAYWRGTAVAGIDPGHTRLRLPDDLIASGGTLLIESTCARTGIWVPGAGEGVDARGSEFKGAFLCSRDEEAWAASFDVEVLLGLAIALHRRDNPGRSDLPNGFGWRAPIENLDPLGRRILVGLDAAVDAYDHGGPAALREVTGALLASLPAAATASTVLLTGHMHIDLVWLWPERTGEFKAVHSLANALDVGSRYPELVFNQSQPAMLEAVQRRDPGLHRRLIEAAKPGPEGRPGFEPLGAMYVESDTQLPCGEALVRAFELGQAGFRKLRPDGRDSPIVWLPDVFGYSAALPTIMAGFGVPYFYTTKMHWSGATRIPYSSFKWRGMDGSEVLTHLSWNFYNAAATVDEVLHPALQDRQSGVHDETLLAVGYGDGGGGPNDAMAERVRRMNDLAGMPRTGWGTVEGFFDRLDEKRDRLPTYAGEMYLEYHRGVQTTRSELKARFRALERALQLREAAACLPGGAPAPGSEAAGRLTHAWKRCVFAQFHDYIPGSSVPDVYDEALPELASLAEEMEAAAEASLEASGDRPIVFNPLPVPRTEEVGGRMVELPPLAAVAAASLREADLPATSLSLSAEAATLDNGRVRVVFNASGEAESLASRGTALPLRSPAGRLFTFPDRPAKYEAWDIDLPTLSNGRVVDTPAERSVEGEGTHAPTLVFRRALGRKSRAELRYRLLPGESVVRLEIRLDWRDERTLLKWSAETGFTGGRARYGAPYGAVLRPQSPGPLAHDAAFEVPGSRWAAVSDDTESEGFQLVTEAKYGFGARDGLLHCSLIRSALSTAHSGGGNDSAGTGPSVTDLGEHTIRLAFGPHADSAPRAEQPAALADRLFTPAVEAVGSAAHAGLLGVEGGESLVPAWAKPAADGDGDGAAGARGFTLRLHETLGRRGTATLMLADGFAAERVDLRGRRLGDAGGVDGPRVPIGFTAYQIVSLAIRRK
ncbi:alpha-mannosidase [Phycisphaera mikurensis]|uniref:Alpha-mannosidase n=1 Tax=Phycisphaera mikurensis (strain NBRC 102666 / KCTC 22515 / FYK2301M01) TaxID=1142394 RepID=I0IDF5_PHYMF|nr:alpha-mannosidase [Phycisphaera mikurensis]MBB6443322.1 alpha-mannosidase [Phycisphaera mikurensis]BAM03293.1 alpha-mannosidase [Phycisphaera mikurensis NBRC 102666]